MNHVKVAWVDAKRDPKCPPDPRYPSGVDLDCSNGEKPACKFDLPYPAKRCGYYYVECTKCKTNLIITTAGRADDPLSITMACQKRIQ